MNNRNVFGSPVHIEGDWLEGDMCATRGCRGTPDEAGRLYCYSCERKQLQAEEDAIEDDGDKAFDAARDEGLL